MRRIQASGTTLTEAERHTKRIRISSLAFALAERLAVRRQTVAEVIEDVLIQAAQERAKKAT
jgi:hypothetical protein